MHIQSVLIVHRKSLYQIYVEEHKERSVRLAIERGDKVAQGIKRAHKSHDASMAKVKQVLRKHGIEYVVRYRARARSSRSYDLVISLGGDGTLLDTSHRILDDTPLLGVNSDPKRSVGALCAGPVGRLPELLEGLRSKEIRPERLTRIRVRIDGKEVLGPTLNDVLVAHICPAGLSRFDLATVPVERALKAHSGRSRTAFVQLRGSGLWVSTAAGSTAAIRSAGGLVMPPGSRRLQYLVREPYIPRGAGRPENLHGFVRSGQALVLTCRLRQGKIWADGAHRKHSLDYGVQVVLDRHPMPLRLVR